MEWILLFALALATRLLFLGHDQFWMDEAYSAIVSGWPLEKLIAEIPGIGSPPLYNLILHFWMKLFGSGEWVLRFPSVVAGSLFVVLVADVGRFWFSKTAGRVTGIAALISGVHLFYSQQARAYSFVILLSLLSAHWLLRYLTQKKKRHLAGYAATLAALLYLHNWSLFLVAIPYAMLAVERRFRPLLPGLLLAHAAVFLLYLPFVPSLLAQAGSGSDSWIAAFWRSHQPLLAYLKSFEIFFAGGEFLAFKKIPVLRIIALTLLLFIFGNFVWRLLRPLRGLAMTEQDVIARSEATKQSILFFTLYLFVPILIPYLFSFYRPMYISGRYDMIVFPAFCLLLGLAFSKLPRRLFGAALGLYLALSAVNLAAYYVWHPPRQENRQMAALLREKGKTGDVLLFTGMSRAPIQYYLGKDFDRFETRHFPAHAATTLGYFDYPRYAEQKKWLGQEAAQLASSFLKRPRPPRRVWVVYTRWLSFIHGADADRLNDPLFTSLHNRFRLLRLHPFRKAYIWEMEPDIP